MVWEVIFMLVILKIPIVYLAVVIWWAIKAEPDPGEPAGVTVVSDTPGPGRSPRARRRRGRRPNRPHSPGHGSGAMPAAQRGTVRS
ncbi:hypothetical protein [Gaiella sp.]|uniref:hypothetical protein n=1 Tax=Gaiella sp. TaxID=2663207 RepID=UPI003265E000